MPWSADEQVPLRQRFTLAATFSELTSTPDMEARVTHLARAQRPRGSARTVRGIRAPRRSRRPWAPRGGASPRLADRRGSERVLIDLALLQPEGGEVWRRPFPGSLTGGAPEADGAFSGSDCHGVRDAWNSLTVYARRADPVGCGDRNACADGDGPRREGCCGHKFALSTAGVDLFFRGLCRSLNGRGPCQCGPGKPHHIDAYFFTNLCRAGLMVSAT